jgi:DNA-binding transcriptional LysR family regulator
MDRFSSMLSFVKVVENGSFAAAARQLNLSPSLVTTHIKSLEDRLGVRLLNRSTRKVGLTDEGKSYFERCLQILAEIEEADQIAESSQLKPKGTLRLNVAQAIPPVITPALVEFVTRYPDASVRLTVTSRMVDLIEEGYDLAIRLAPAHDSSLIVRHLATYRMVVCGAPNYFARYGRPNNPDELVRHNCMLFYDSLWGKEWRFNGTHGEQIVRVSGNLETNSVVTLRLAAIQGEGLICAPSFMVDAELRSGQLVPVLTKFMPLDFSIDAYYPHRRYVSARVRTFIDLLVAHFRGANWSEPAELHARSAAR